MSSQQRRRRRPLSIADTLERGQDEDGHLWPMLAPITVSVLGSIVFIDMVMTLGLAPGLLTLGRFSESWLLNVSAQLALAASSCIYLCLGVLWSLEVHRSCTGSMEPFLLGERSSICGLLVVCIVAAAAVVGGRHALEYDSLDVVLRRHSHDRSTAGEKHIMDMVHSSYMYCCAGSKYVHDTHSVPPCSNSSSSNTISNSSSSSSSDSLDSSTTTGHHYIAALPQLLPPVEAATSIAAPPCLFSGSAVPVGPYECSALDNLKTDAATGKLVSRASCAHPSLFSAFLATSFGVKNIVIAWRLAAVVTALIFVGALWGLWDSRRRGAGSTSSGRQLISARGRLSSSSSSSSSSAAGTAAALSSGSPGSSGSIRSRAFERMPIQ
eukprot:g3570.t1